MIIRRILLLLGSLVVLGGGLLGYRHFAGGPPKDDRDFESMPVEKVPRPKLGGARLPGTGKGTVVTVRDKDGHLQAVYRATRWDRQDDGSYRLTQPTVMYSLSGGQQIHIRGDKAVVYMEEVPGGFNPRRGRLYGNVTVIFDQAALLDRTPFEQRPEDLVWIHADDMHFDNDRLEITTDGPITLFSSETDLAGRGLQISWHEAPRELRHLRVTEGEIMVIKQVPERFTGISLPGGSATEGAAREAPASAPAPPAGGAVEPTPPVAAVPAAKPPAGPQARKRKNIYRAEFVGDKRLVNVDHGGNRLHGARTLSLVFEWERSGPSRRPLGPSRSAGATRPALTTNHTKAPEAESGPAKPMIITWRGPLILRPIGRTETPSDRRTDVAASGERVELADARARATCREFEYHSPAQAGLLRGTRENPVRLVTADGDEIECPLVRFSRTRGQAELIGPGHMARRAGSEISLVGQARPASSQPAPLRGEAVEKITWSESVTAAFGRYEAGGGRRARPRDYLKHALFRGDVELRQLEAGDFVRCRELEVWLAPPTAGAGAHLSRAVATGDVTARQEGSDIRGRKVTVHFRPVAPASGGEPAERRVRPSRLRAEGNVRVTDASDKQAGPLVVTCDRLDADLLARQAVLYGRPARIVQGTNRISGPRIDLTEAGEDAVVSGRGQLEFQSDRDLNGAELPAPRTVRVRWSRGMTYHGEKREAAFEGGVRLDSGLDHLSCGRMRLWFERPKGTTQPAPSSGAPAAGRETRGARLALGMERYSKQRFNMILAESNVVLGSREDDEQGWWLRRLQLTGERLVFDAEKNNMDVFGAGTLLLEDYRPPGKPDRKRTSGAMPAEVERPSQTSFEWARRMSIFQAKRLVEMEGDVVMHHRSGNQLVLAERLHVRPWPKLASGRRTKLSCRKLRAQFEEAKSSAAAAPAVRPAERGPRLGPIRLFNAIGDVVLRDGLSQILGQRLIYDRPKDLIIVYGYLDGQAKANATLIREDPQTRRSRTSHSPKFSYNPRTQQVLTEEIRGGG